MKNKAKRILPIALACAMNAAAQDTPTVLWTGNGENPYWSNTDNWSGPSNAPGNLVGAQFTAPFNLQPTVTANANVKGLWVGGGVGQDVVINGDDSGTQRQLTIYNNAVLNGVAGGGGWNADTALILLDAPGRNLTFGPGINLGFQSTAVIAHQSGGVLDLQCPVGIPNGAGLRLWSTNANSVIRVSGPGYIWRQGGGNLHLNMEGGLFHVDGTEPFGTEGSTINSGTLRLTSPVSLTNSNITMSQPVTTRVELWHDDPPEHPVLNNFYWNNGTVDVSRATSGPADYKATRVKNINVGGTSTHYLTSAHGRTLKVDELNLTGLGGGPKSYSTLYPIGARFEIETMTIPANALGSGTFCFDGPAQPWTNVVGAIVNPPSTPYGFPVVKSGGSVWRIESPGDYAGATTVNGPGRLIVAADEAIGHGGETHVGDAGQTQVNGTGILDIAGVGVTEQINLANNAILVNDAPGTLGVIHDGVAHLQLYNVGSGFKVADLGRSLDLSQGDGSGAAAVISGLRLNNDSITASGGDNWASGDFITVPSGTGSDARFMVDNVANGAITDHHMDTQRPGHGYTAVPNAYTKSNNGRTGETVVFHDAFSVGSIRLTKPGHGGGYRENFPVFLPDDAFGSDVIATAVVATVHIQGAYNGTSYHLGGDGDLRIDAPVTAVGVDGAFRKIGSGALSLASSNTLAIAVFVDAGALSACNATGSATGSNRITVSSNACLAGSGVFKPSNLNTNLNPSIRLLPGAGVAPHRGTGQDVATLTCDVSHSPRADAMLIEEDCFFEFAVGPNGADKLVVIGNLTMNAGMNTVRVVPKPGLAPGVYRVLDFQGGVVDKGVDWVLEPGDSRWQCKFQPDETGAWLNVTSAATLFMVR